jgi:cytidine deaminase
MNMLDSLFEAASLVQKQAYAPYSRFKVGTALISDDGNVYIGCNVENAAYPLGLCAESSAIAMMIARGGRLIRHLVVYGEGESLITPCGACRQRIREFSDAATRIHAADRQGIQQSWDMAQLLPQSFGPDHLSGPA